MTSWPEFEHWTHHSDGLEPVFDALVKRALTKTIAVRLLQHVQGRRQSFDARVVRSDGFEGEVTLELEIHVGIRTADWKTAAQADARERIAVLAHEVAHLFQPTPTARELQKRTTECLHREREAWDGARAFIEALHSSACDGGFWEVFESSRRTCLATYEAAQQP